MNIFNKIVNTTPEETAKENEVLATVYLIVAEFHREGKGTITDVLKAAQELREIGEDKGWTDEQFEIAAQAAKEGLVR